MGPSSATRLLYLLAVAFVAAACGGGDGPTDPPEVASLTIGVRDANLAVGDTQTLALTATDASGRVVAVSAPRWQSADALVAEVSAAGVVIGRRAGETTVTAEAAGRTARVPVRVGIAYTEAELTYFAEVAAGLEFGTLSPTIRKWRFDILLRTTGDATAAERVYVDSLAAELTRLIGGAVRVRSDPNGNVPVLLMPPAQFAQFVPAGLAGLGGYVSLQVDASNHLYGAAVYVRTDLPPGLRRRLLREEITQGLGLGRDSRRHPRSTFYDGYHEEPEFAPIDRALVEMLYRDEVKVGMTTAEAVAVLRTLRRRGAPPA